MEEGYKTPLFKKGEKEMRNRIIWPRLLFVLSLFPLVGWVATRTILYLQFYNGCEKYVEKAVDASNIRDAEVGLYVAIQYLEQNNLTHGTTSIDRSSLDEENLEVWYNNLKSILESLDKTKQTELRDGEEKIILEGLRWNLTTPDFGDKIPRRPKTPSGISIFPHNMAFAWWIEISGVLLFLAFLYLLYELSPKTYR